MYINNWKQILTNFKGLVDIASKQNGTQDFFQPFPPAHYATYDVTVDGKLQMSEMKKFHCFVDMPQHWKYQRIQLKSGVAWIKIRQ